jgi:hypothetical protein
MAGNEDRAVYCVTGDLSNLSVSRSSLQHASPAPLEGSTPIPVSMFHTLSHISRNLRITKKRNLDDEVTLSSQARLIGDSQFFLMIYVVFSWFYV